jgi:hypothetical protein
MQLAYASALDIILVGELRLPIWVDRRPTYFGSPR